MADNKDRSKYILNGNSKPYGKGRLVNAVLKEYVLNHPGKTYADLKQDFPDKLQATQDFQTLGVFTTKKNADLKPKQFYVNAKDLIHLKDEIIAICNQWNFHNILVFIEHARGLGLKIDFDKERLGRKQADKILWIGSIEEYFLVALDYFERENPMEVIHIFRNPNFPKHQRKFLMNLIKEHKRIFPRLYKLISSL